ncbi:MAG: hypothetical protein ABI857_13105 [Acidobacteriota bacterium]
MKPISETRALEKLHKMKTDFARRIRDGYEHRALSCVTCQTPGACCLDSHFVNVHITRLEAVAIRNAIAKLSEEKQERIFSRIQATISKYELSSDGDTFSKTYACPLFEKGTGCLVHQEGKPSPCIAHACYENKEDLPPDEILAEQEAQVEKLNELTYRKPTNWLPLPIAIKRVQKRRRFL